MKIIIIQLYIIIIIIIIIYYITIPMVNRLHWLTQVMSLCYNIINYL
jgi:hypothetical protein